MMICDIKNMNRGDRKYGQCDDGWKITCDEMGNEMGNQNDFPGQSGLAEGTVRQGEKSGKKSVRNIKKNKVGEWKQIRYNVERRTGIAMIENLYKSRLSGMGYDEIFRSMK